MSKRTLGLIIFLLLMTASLLYVAFALKTKTAPTPFSPGASPKITNAQTILTLSPNPVMVSSSSASITVDLASGSNKITAVQLELGFDPSHIKNIVIVPGSFFETPLVLINKIDEQTGKIFYAIAITPTGVAKVKSGTAATITFSTNLAPGQKTDITILQRTLVTAEGVKDSVLKTAIGTTIQK